MATHVSWLA